MESIRGSYPFKIGNFECLVINDCWAFKPPHAAPDDTMEVNCLFVRTGKNTVLIDTGWGVGVGNYDGKLVQGLQQEGIQCSEIDTVIISHAHLDHMGGNADAQGRAVFPNARYIMHRKELEFWISEPDITSMEESMRVEQLQAVQKRLIPVQDRILPIDGETEIVSGIELIEAPGHTPGHIALVISSDAEQLLCIGDMFRKPSELAQRGLYPGFDLSPEQASHTRVQILSRIVKTNPLVFSEHFHFPGLGHIAPKGDAWLWQPLNITV